MSYCILKQKDLGNQKENYFNSLDMMVPRCEGTCLQLPATWEARQEDLPLKVSLGNTVTR
jgi:hypothetical protein